MTAIVTVYALRGAPERGPLVVRVDPPGSRPPLFDVLDARRLSPLEVATIELARVVAAVVWHTADDAAHFVDVEAWRGRALAEMALGAA